MYCAYFAQLDFFIKILHVVVSFAYGELCFNSILKKFYGFFSYGVWWGVDLVVVEKVPGFPYAMYGGSYECVGQCSSLAFSFYTHYYVYSDWWEEGWVYS